MTAKEYLNQLRVIDKRICNLLREKESIWTMLTRTTTPYDKDRVQSSSKGDLKEECIDRLEELEKRIDYETDKLIDKRATIFNQINALSNYQSIDILYRHYVQLIPLTDIATDLSYSYAWVKELHATALQDFERTYPNLPLDVLV